MSRELGMDCINCRPTPRPGHVEYLMEYHRELIRKVTSADTGSAGVSAHAADYNLLPPDAQRRFYDAWDYDFLWGTHDGFVDWAKAGRCTDMGHAVYAADGTVDMFLEDVAACGADGFIFEPSNDFEKIVNALGGSHCLFGSQVDCRTMAFGTWEQVRAEIDATLALTRGMPGHFFAVGNHIPANVSDEMCLQFMDCLRANW